MFVIKSCRNQKYCTKKNYYNQICQYNNYFSFHSITKILIQFITELTENLCISQVTNCYYKIHHVELLCQAGSSIRYPIEELPCSLF